MSDSRYGADAHNTDYERGREEERAAIVAWLRDGTEPFSSAWVLSECIVSGEHLRGDDE